MARSEEYILGNQYLFSEGSGSSVNDTADSNDITLTGSPNWVAGRLSGYALEFTGGATQYGQGAVNWSANEPDPRVNGVYWWLIRIWFKTATASGRPFFGIRQYASSYNVCAYIGTDGKAKVLFPSIASAGTLLSSSKTVTDGEWHELLMSHCSGDPFAMVGRYYLDSEYLGSGTGLGEVAHSNSAAPLRIGGGIYLPSTYSGAHSTPSDTAGWTGTLGSVDVWWWNGETCTAAQSAAEDEITWMPPGPTVTNALMFSCNT